MLIGLSSGTTEKAPKLRPDGTRLFQFDLQALEVHGLGGTFASQSLMGSAAGLGTGCARRNRVCTVATSVS